MFASMRCFSMYEQNMGERSATWIYRTFLSYHSAYFTFIKTRFFHLANKRGLRVNFASQFLAV